MYFRKLLLFAVVAVLLCAVPQPAFAAGESVSAVGRTAAADVPPKLCIRKLIEFSLYAFSNYETLWPGLFAELGAVKGFDIVETGTRRVLGFVLPPVTDLNAGKLANKLRSLGLNLPSSFNRADNLHDLLASWSLVNSDRGNAIAFFYKDFDECKGDGPNFPPPPALSSSSRITTQYSELPLVEFRLPELPSGVSLAVVTEGEVSTGQHELPSMFPVVFIGVLFVAAAMLLLAATRRPAYA